MTVAVGKCILLVTGEEWWIFFGAVSKFRRRSWDGMCLEAWHSVEIDSHIRGTRQDG
jgi:hypothetical protein